MDPFICLCSPLKSVCVQNEKEICWENIFSLSYLHINILLQNFDICNFFIERNTKEKKTKIPQVFISFLIKGAISFRLLALLLPWMLQQFIYFYICGSSSNHKSAHAKKMAQMGMTSAT